MTSAAASSSSRQSTASRRLVKLSRASTMPGSASARPRSCGCSRRSRRPRPRDPCARCRRGAARTSKDRASRPRHDLSAIRRVARAEQAFAVARELDDEVPLAGKGSGEPAKLSWRFSLQAHRPIGAPVGRMRETRGRLQAGKRAARRVARIDLDQCVAGDRLHMRLHLPVQRVLASRPRDLAREGEAGLIGACRSRRRRRSRPRRGS